MSEHRPWSVYTTNAISDGHALGWRTSFGTYERAAKKAQALVEEPSREHHRVTLARVFWDGSGPDPLPAHQKTWRRS